MIFMNRSCSFPSARLRMLALLLLLALASLSLIGAPGQSAASPSAIPAASASGISGSQAFVTKYCVTCHNSRLKTAGFVLDPAELANPGATAEQWEKVVKKLRTGAMPPNGAPRPDQAAYDSTATYIETELDRAFAAKPEPGKLPMFHRLTRFEYANAVRDLLGLSVLPKEMDYPVLLPQDNASSGFDNLADLLFISPTTMERYLGAARKISRLAIGDPKIPVIVDTYRLSGERPQTERLDELSFGTRGGVAIRSDLPLDGEYNVHVEFAGPATEQYQLEITVDGERARLVTVGEARTDVRQSTGVRIFRGPEKPMEIRIPMKAGNRLIGVSFIQRSQARDEETVRPRGRGRGPFLALASVTLSGPFNGKVPEDTPSRRAIFSCRPKTAAEETPCAKQILSTLARRAYRRPVNDADIQDLMPFYNEGKAEASFDLGIQKSVERLLVSPQFLFRIERDPANIAPGSIYRVSDLELASRLSFFLWSSVPDDELISVASKGGLKDPAVFEKQVRRMLADPRAETMVTNFAAQWLYIRDIDAKRPDEILFPDYDENLRNAFRKETEMFVGSVFLDNKSVVDLLTANYTFVNERLAKHYGIPNVEGSYFRRVNYPEGSLRAGLLGQGSILTLTSYATRTSPVVRGKWVLENLLSAPPPPPPPNVPALKTESSENKPLTMREAMIQHRANPTCAACHSRMDPIGFAMENFDAVGRYRERDNGHPIDVSGTMPDGAKFEGMAGLRAQLLKHPDQFVTTITEKLLMYGVARNLQYYDAPAVRSIVHESAKSNYTFASLVMGVVKSSQFQTRRAQPAQQPATSASVAR
jgi:mono/diheme cytochrome c family protein